MSDLGHVTVAPDDDWIEYGPPGARTRVGFHDYGAIYAVPGLYERVFYDALAMRTLGTVVGLYRETLAAEGLDPAAQRVLDLGAGNGAAGAALREAGVGFVVGLDLEPAARDAAARDRPGVYDDYVVCDLASWPAERVEALRGHRLTAMVAVAALGAGHVPPDVLARAIDVVEPGGLFAFAVLAELLPGTEDPAGLATGYPAFLAALFGEGGATELARREYVHRQTAGGEPQHAAAFAGRRALAHRR
jgi:SAM-dependent methyltransferase